MRIEPSRETFRGLLWLDVVSMLAILIALLPNYFAGRWYEFEGDVGSLVDQHFGSREFPAVVETTLMIAVGLTAAWLIASIVGLFWYKPWARLGYWLSILVGFGLLTVLDGFRPTFSSTPEDALVFVNSAVSGAVVLVSYMKGAGDEWFSEPGTDRI